MEDPMLDLQRVYAELMRKTRGENLPPPPSMEWQKYIEWIHCSVNEYEINPKDKTEQSYFEWIIDRQDIQTKIDSWLTFTDNENKESRKNDDKAKQFKEEGNALFKKQDFPASIKCYTESARYSTVESESEYFSVAIANRSAAFFNMCRYKESLGDIDVALKTGYPEDLMAKLYLRAAQCHLRLRQGKLAEDSIAKLLKLVETSSHVTDTMKDMIRKAAEDLLTSASESQKRYENFKPASTAKVQPVPENMLDKNTKFPFASSAVVRKRSPTRGRYTVAAQPVKKGDVLFVEKPFAWVPVTHGNNVSLCDHCCGPLDDSLLPCRRCVDASYCSSTCWTESMVYHQWECPGYHLGLWQQIGVSHLAFKILLMSVATTDKVWFNDVQNLVTNVDKKSADDIFGLAIASLLLTTYIEKYTYFFDTIDLQSCLVDKFTDPGMSFDFDISTRKGKKLYVGSLILRHSLQMLANAYAVTRLVDASPSTERESFVEEQQRIAAGAYPSASMMNHSCDPSVIHTFWNNWLIIKAVKDIRKGDEIFNCYGMFSAGIGKRKKYPRKKCRGSWQEIAARGPYFKRMSKAKRQTDLLNQYSFDCKCSACTNPLFDHYTDRFDGLKCPKCSGSLQHLPASRNDNTRMRCFDCGAVSKETCNADLQIATEFYDKGLDLADIDKWEEATRCFEKSLAIREKYLYKHNDYVAITLDGLGKSYASTGHWLKSISYLERSIAAVEERYGSDSIEIANELNKLTDVCFQYLKRTLSRRSRVYRDTFVKTRKYVDRALAIFSLTGGPWNDRYQEMEDKSKELSGMMEQLRS